MKYCVSLFLLLGYYIAVCQDTPFPTDFAGCGFTAVGHRGYSEFYPENTLVAIEEAFKRGIEYCEVDVAVSSDGVYFYTTTLTPYRGQLPVKELWQITLMNSCPVLTPEVGRHLILKRRAFPAW